MRWISATQLFQWADTKDCEGNLPVLVRKLIVASGSDWTKVQVWLHEMRLIDFMIKN
jgi:hypothetical protein